MSLASSSPANSGMGLIRNAIEQGRQAIDCATAQRSWASHLYDVVIVGGGAAGFSASPQRCSTAFGLSRLSRTAGGTVATSARQACYDSASDAA